jgi:hypothetical protein
MFGENTNGDGTTFSFSTNGGVFPEAMEASGRSLTPEELQAMQTAVTTFGGAVQRGLSFGVAGVSLVFGLGLGYLIWGRKSDK